MRHLTITVILLLITTSIFGQRRARYVHSDIAKITANHKSIAILPIKSTISLRPNVMNALSEEELREREKRTSYSVQSSIESYFLNKKRRKGTRVKIQNIKETNRILKSNNINIDDLGDYSSKELAELLNVDAIISGSIGSSKPNSNEAALAISLLLDRRVRTNMSSLQLSLTDKSSDVLWKFQDTVSRGFGSETGSTVTPLLRRSARKLPYGQAR